MVWLHGIVLLWIFMVQKWTSVPTKRMDNRFQHDDGSIANINADGTFTHTIAEEEDDD